MKSPKNALILLLAATTVAGVVLAWRQYRELVELRSAAMNKTERADLQRKVWDLEKSNRELRDQLARRGGAGEAEGETASADGGRSGRDDPSRGPGRGGRGDPRREGEQQYAAVREMMSRPEVQAMISQQQKAAIDARYAPLFKSLNLPPEQVDKLKALLAERSTTMQDILTVAREQGVNPRENPEAFRKLMTDAQNEINRSIRTVVGEQGFAQLTNFEQTLPQRGVVNDLQQRLSFTNAPLTTAQAEQLVQILAANPAPRPAGAPTDSGMGPRPPPEASVFIGRGGPPGGFDGGPMGGRGPDIGGVIAGVLSGGGVGMVVGAPDGGRGGGTAIVTPGAVAQAQTVLTPPQVAALQQIQQQQQTQQQLRQVVSEALSTARPPAESGTSGTGQGGGLPSGSGTRGPPKAAPRPGG